MADGPQNPDLLAGLPGPGADVVAAPEPQAAPPAPAAAAAEPTHAPDLAAAEPAIVLTTDRPSMLEGVGKPEAPKAEDVKAPEPAKPAEVKPEADKPAVADDKPKPEADKPVEAPAAEVKPEEAAKPVEVAAPEPVKYEWELPALLKAAPERIEAFNAILNEAKLPAEIGKEAGQKLLGLHEQAMQTYADTLAQETLRNQHKAFNDMREGWNTEILADPEFGGAGHATATKAVARARDALVSSHPIGSKEYQADYAQMENFLRVTGAGDHPVMWRILHNAARYIDEPQAASIPTNISPPKGNGKAPKAGIYTHPSSQNMNNA